MHEENKGILFVCGTPIGNLGDVSFRLLDTLKQADMILAEDTRTIRKLLSRYDVAKKEIISYHQHSTTKKLDSSFWQKLIKTTRSNPYLVAIDGTGLSRTNPSYHYLKRINGGMPKVPVKLSSSFDTRKKKFCAAKVRVLKAHDIKDAKSLIGTEP